MLAPLNIENADAPSFCNRDANIPVPSATRANISVATPPISPNVAVNIDASDCTSALALTVDIAKSLILSTANPATTAVPIFLNAPDILPSDASARPVVSSIAEFAESLRIAISPNSLNKSIC